MKLNELDFSLASDLQLTHPVTGEELGVSLRVVGRDSLPFRKATTELMKARLSTTPLSPDELIRHNTDLVSSLILGWSDDEFFSGPYTAEAAKAIVANPGYTWLREQVEAFIQERSNFFRPSGIAA